LGLAFIPLKSVVTGQFQNEKKSASDPNALRGERRGLLKPRKGQQIWQILLRSPLKERQDNLAASEEREGARRTTIFTIFL